MPLPKLTLNSVIDTTDDVATKYYTRTVTVVDNKGRPHDTDVQFFNAENESCTFVRYKLWPGSPRSATIAFQFALLDFQRMLQLESHVSLQSFCSVIKLLQEDHSTVWNFTNRSNLYL